MNGRSPTLVLVHGGAHDSRCWQPTVDALAEIAPDVRVIAVDLPGRGRCAIPLEEMTIATCVDAVVGQNADAGADDVVLVGHSMAGLTIPAAAIALGPERVRRLVYVACSTPPDGSSIAASVSGRSRLALRVGRRFLDRGGTMPWPLARAAFCNGMTAVQRSIVREQLVAESSVLLKEPVDRSRLDPSIPATWVLTLQDRSLSPRQQRRSIANLGGVDRVVELDACHDAMVSHPTELARILVADAVTAER